MNNDNDKKFTLFRKRGIGPLSFFSNESELILSNNIIKIHCVNKILGIFPFNKKDINVNSNDIISLDKKNSIDIIGVIGIILFIVGIIMSIILFFIRNRSRLWILACFFIICYIFFIYTKRNK